MQNVLRKDPKYTYIPGSPGVPGTPYVPAKPGYWSTEVVCDYVATDPVTGIPIGDPTSVYSFGGVTIAIWEQVCSETTVWVPGTPAIPGTTPVPATAGSTTVDNNIGWNAGAISAVGVLGDGGFSWRIGTSSTGVVIGLAAPNDGVGIYDIKHGFYFESKTGLKIMESGVVKLWSVPYAEGDQLSIMRVGALVTYWHNGSKVYTSSQPSAGTVFLDVSLYVAGDYVYDPDLFAVNALRAQASATSSLSLSPALRFKTATAASSLKASVRKNTDVDLRAHFAATPNTQVVMRAIFDISATDVDDVSLYEGYYSDYPPSGFENVGKYVIGRASFGETYTTYKFSEDGRHVTPVPTSYGGQTMTAYSPYLIAGVGGGMNIVQPDGVEFYVGLTRPAGFLATTSIYAEGGLVTFPVTWENSQSADMLVWDKDRAAFVFVGNLGDPVRNILTADGTDVSYEVQSQPRPTSDQNQITTGTIKRWAGGWVSVGFRYVEPLSPSGSLPHTSARVWFSDDLSSWTEPYASSVQLNVAQPPSSLYLNGTVFSTKLMDVYTSGSMLIAVGFKYALNLPNISPVTPMYGSQAKDFPFIIKSIDGGVTWADVSPLRSSPGISARITRIFSVGDVLVGATMSEFVYLSYDGGDTWVCRLTLVEYPTLRLTADFAGDGTSFIVGRLLESVSTPNGAVVRDGGLAVTHDGLNWDRIPAIGEPEQYPYVVNDRVALAQALRPVSDYYFGEFTRAGAVVGLAAYSYFTQFRYISINAQYVGSTSTDNIGFQLGSDLEVWGVAYDPLYDTVAVAVTRFDDPSKVYITSAKHYSASPGIIQHIITSDVIFGFNPFTGKGIMRLAANSGNVYVCPYEGQVLARVNTLTTDVEARRVGDAAEFLYIAANDQYVAYASIVDDDWSINLADAQTLDYVSTIVPASPARKQAFAFVGDELAVVVDRELRRYDMSGNLIAAYPQYSVKFMAPISVIGRFLRVQLETPYGAYPELLVLDTQADWVRVESMSYLPES